MRAVGLLAYDAYARRTSGEPGRHSWVVVPRSCSFIDRFGGWGPALYAAGLIRREELSRYRKKYARGMSDERAFSYLAAAMRDLGPDISRGAYREWRARLVRTVGYETVPAPHDTVLCQRAGPGKKWLHAGTRARDLVPAADAPPEALRESTQCDDDRPTPRTDNDHKGTPDGLQPQDH